MKLARTIGLSVMACLLLGAALSAAASAAEPALYECHKTVKNAEKKYEAGYNDKLCSEKNPTHEGKYELQEGIGKGKKFKGKGGGANLEVKGLGGVGCT